MANTSKSGQLAAHNRYHAGKGIRKSNCAVCRERYPELKDVPLDQDLTLPVPVYSEPVTPSVESVLLAQSITRSRVWSAAAVCPTQGDAAAIFGMTPEQFEVEIKKVFGFGWEQATRLAFMEMRRTIWEHALKGDARFVLLLAKMKSVSGWYDEPPEALYEEGTYENLTTEELEKKSQKFMAVVGRKSRFQEVGAISPTLEVLPSGTPPVGFGQSKEREPAILSHDGTAVIEPPTAIEKPGPKLSVAEAKTEEKPQEKELKPLSQGPVTYVPPQGEPLLVGSRGGR